MTITSIKNHPVIPKQVVTVVDLGYLGIEKIMYNNLPLYRIKKKRNQRMMSRKKKNITNFT